jgi:VCBS repeat-containing protein
VALTGSVVGNDADVDSTVLSAVLVNGTVNGALTLGADGRFSYVPAANFNGTDSFTYRVNDGLADSNTATVSIAIVPVNDPPVANSQIVMTEKKRAVGITVTAQDQEGSPLTYRIVRGPLNGSLSGTPPKLQYTPDKKFIGVDSFAFVANDGAADSTVAVVLIAVVEDMNDPPVAYDQSVKVKEGDSERIELRGKDPDGKQLTYIIVSRPSNGTLSGSGQTLRYTPTPKFSGQDRFTFKISDSVRESNVATVTITVRADKRQDGDDDDHYFWREEKRED